MRRGVIIHHPSDTVGVAIVDLEPGEQFRALLRDGGTEVVVTPTDPIPLGHKVALADVGQGEQVVEYGLSIGRAVRAIAAGEHVHTQDADLLGSQPTQGNIAGGLTTIEEKALGNIQKIGNATVDGALEMAEAPPRCGLYFMDTSSAAAESVTLFAAGGAALHLFTTGQGNITGNPLVPVLKLTANPKTAASMREHIDLDVSKTISLEQTLDEAADALTELIVRTTNGRWTAAETLGHREFALTRLHRTA